MAMLKSILGRLEPEDVTRMHTHDARKWAMETHPEAYSATEMESAYLSRVRFWHDVHVRYGLPDGESYAIDAWNGVITESEG